MATATYPVEEPTVYGALFEQADPWDTIGQILGLPNTKPSKSPGEVIVNELDEIYEIDQSEVSFEIVVGQEEAENAGTALNLSALSPQQEIAQVSEAGPSGDIENEEFSKEYESALAIPELEELDGFFIGPSLFDLDKDEDEI
jgi:hypothetical protein